MIAEKLLILQDIKEDIINALIEKGVEVNTNNFNQFADLIRSISDGNLDEFSYTGALHIITRNQGPSAMKTINDAAINGPGLLNIVEEE